MTWTGGEARPGHRLGGTQRLTSPRGGGVLETSSPQDPGDEEHVAVRGNQLAVPDPSSRGLYSAAGGGPYAPRPRCLIFGFMHACLGRIGKGAYRCWCELAHICWQSLRPEFPGFATGHSAILRHEDSGSSGAASSSSAVSVRAAVPGAPLPK